MSHRFDGWYMVKGSSDDTFWLCTCGYREMRDGWGINKRLLVPDELVARHLASLDLSGLPSMQELLDRQSTQGVRG